MRPLTSTWFWAAVSGVFLAWILTGPVRSLGNRSVGVSATVALYFIAAGLLVRSARNAGIRPGLATALRWIAASQVLYGLGTLYGLYTILYRPSDNARFDTSDLFFIAGYPAILAGLLSLPRVERSRASRSRILVDTAVFLAGVGVPLWLFTLGPGLATASWFEGAMYVAYPVATFSGIATLNVILLTRAPLPNRGAFGLLVAAICVLWIADLIYLLDSVQGLIARGPVDWSDVSSTLSILLFILAAGRIDAHGTKAPADGQAAASSPLPSVTILAVSSWLVLLMVNGHPEPSVMARILSCLILLFLVLSVREAFLYRDNIRMLAIEVEREARARFEVLVQHSSDLIMLVDAEHRIRFASPAVHDALGMTEGEVVGQPLLHFAHEDDLARGARFLDSVAATGEARFSVRWRLRHADKSFRIFDTLGSRVPDGSSLAGMVITSRDVTRQVELDDKLRQSQKLEAVGQLVGGIAHNFNNILTSTLMRLGLLKGNSTLPTDVRDEILALEKEARRTADLTRKLGLFGTQQHTDRRAVNLWERLERLRPEIERLIGEGVQLHTTGGSEPAVVVANGDLIDYSILSLCANARDAMKDGGCLIIEVTVLRGGDIPPDPEGAPRPGPFVRLSIQDNGTGMTPEVMEHMFEPFFTTKGPTGSHGMGLASVHGVVKMHQGWMQVESSLGTGSTFRIFLPCAPASAA